jgi:uncharacterized protein YkwD
LEGKGVKELKKIIAVFLGVLLVSLLLETGTAHASELELLIRNNFGEKMHTAVVYYDDDAGAWTTIGWYTTEANNSRTVKFLASRQEIFIYSELSGAKTTWGKGDVTRVVIAEKFRYRDGEECPAGTKRRSVKFTKYTAKNGAVNYKPAVTNAPLANAGDTAVLMRNAGGSAAPMTNAGGKRGKERQDPLEIKAANIVNFVNNDRENAGLLPFATGAGLNEAARIRARELSQKNSIDTRPDGRSFETVLTDNGLTMYSEARTFGSILSTDNALEIYRVFQGNAGYREYILSEKKSAIGVGIFKSGRDYFCVQILCSEGAETEKNLGESLKELEESLKKLGDLFD